jgi:hypothetical protein
LYDTVIAPAKLNGAEWFPRATFTWPKIEGHEQLDELLGERASAAIVFCEDTREFVDRSVAPHPAAFVPESNPWGTRFVRKVADFQYAPASRFA